jgi:predicted RND superfamily exporter protein
MFPSGSSTITAMQWVEQHVGPFVSIEVLLDFPNDDTNPLQRVRWLSTIQRNLNELPEVGSTLSAASFLPAIPTASGIRAAASRAVFNAKLRQQLPTLVDQGWIHQDDDRQQWRITCKVSGLQDEDYGVFVDRVQSATQATIEAHADQEDKPLRFSTTGLSPLVHEAQLMLLSDLAHSFLMAFALITPVMMLITRSVFVGGLVMLPNVLPVAIVFGSMGWLGIRMDIAGVLTASIALGIAVDDTLHFVSWYTHAKKMGKNSQDAIFASYQRCALAMLETTLIACSAMLPFLFADFIPTRRFAMLMMLMLTLAIVGDLLLLPALLCCYDRWRSRAGVAARFAENRVSELEAAPVPAKAAIPRQKPRRRQ